MGASQSSGSVLSGGAAAPQVQAGTNHSPLPEDPAPYPGHAHEYRIVAIQAQLNGHFTFGVSKGTQVVSSNIDQYYPTLHQQYAEYLKLSTFFRVPYAAQAGFAQQVVPFQGIFCRPAVYTPSPEAFELTIAKAKVQMSLIVPGQIFSLSMYNCPLDINMKEIYDNIHTRVQTGGRFLGMECNGGIASAGFGSTKTPIYDVDMFFDMPKHPNPTVYTYTVFSTEMHVSYDMGGCQVHCDWNGTLKMHLDKGWKLSDIFIAQQETGMNNQNQHRPRVVNTLWFFEKEANRMHEEFPRYQVTMVEYFMPIKMGFGKIKSNCDLGPMVGEMGRRGWELVCCVDTPQVKRTGMSTMNSSLIVFFQRPIIYNPTPPPAPVAAPTQEPEKTLLEKSAIN